ncbi:adenosylcobinamide hydrolase [Acididesulfobacillus acetoxydans]|uniref:Adenosylcobinamide hydrolase n=1 Tax=Acididesulfobacillus acetoxydans TaxID=1561005 RepID=A0A8S0W5J9_9FIRM|nr:radical SAM protein [Acididesulfobacillus acetoxydans]CAA7603228.1 adenosylcobinamide hydrolase [Acididesulfobacillus acetoxydans]
MRRPKPLKMLVLSLTGQCNFACSYCYAQAHAQESMSLATAIAAVNRAADSGEPFVLQFSGGEPLLSFAVMRDTIQYVRRKRIPALIQVQTNASLLSSQKIAFLRAAQVGIGVSLDGRPGINDRTRRLSSGEGTSRLILGGIEQLARQGVKIGLTCVISEANVSQLAGIVEMAYYLGNVRRLGFDLVRGQGRGSLLQPPAPESIERGLEQALRTAERLGRRSGTTLSIAQLERVKTLARRTERGFAHCPALKGEAAFVDAQGNIYACSSLIGEEKFRLGDVAAGIEESRQEAVVTLMQKSMGFCLECSSFSLCGGGCFARWYGAARSGEAYAGECTLKRVFIKWYLEQRTEASAIT